MKSKLLSCLIFLIFSVPVVYGVDALPSWNEGPAKQAILGFVQKTCTPASPQYVPPMDRIATFDQDGTLWVEYPLNAQAAFALDRVKALASKHPNWKNEEPFKAILAGDSTAIDKFTEQDWQNIVAVTHSGMSTEAFQEMVKEWLKTAKQPKFKRPYRELVYQPMLEVLEFLRANSFKTYIVTGGGQEFVRVYSQSVYGIPSEQVIGSSIATQYEYENGKPVLMELPKVFFIDDHAGKAIGIHLFIGKRPYAAFGNSNGDREMLEWTGAGEGSRLMMLIHHDDSKREYAYGPAGNLPPTHIGAFSDALMEEAKRRGWIVVSMKRDWKQIFSKQ